jgi:uncharacterized protein YcfL
MKSLPKGLLIGLAVLLVYSCGAKKKSTTTEVITEELTKSSDSLTINKLSINKEESKENSTVSSEKGFEIEYEGCEGDSLVVEKTEADGTRTQMTIKGKGKAKISSNEKKMDSKETVINSETKSESSLAMVKKELEKKEQTIKASSELDKKQYNFFSWWWLVLVLIGISLLYLNKRFNIIRKLAVFFNLSKSQDEN